MQSKYPSKYDYTSNIVTSSSVDSVGRPPFPGWAPFSREGGWVQPVGMQEPSQNVSLYHYFNKGVLTSHLGSTLVLLLYVLVELFGLIFDKSDINSTHAGSFGQAVSVFYKC